MTTTLRGSGQAGRVTASASGMTSSSRTGACRAAAAANRAPTLFTELTRVCAPEVPNGESPPTNQISAWSSSLVSRPLPVPPR
jgi:hypothetical protein